MAGTPEFFRSLEITTARVNTPQDGGSDSTQISPLRHAIVLQQQLGAMNDDQEPPNPD